MLEAPPMYLVQDFLTSVGRGHAGSGQLAEGVTIQGKTGYLAVQSTPNVPTLR